MNEREGSSVRLREAFAGLGERAAPGPSCPDPDRLWAAATAESPVEERHEIIAHTATCASCAAAFRLARGLSEDEAGRAGQVVPHSRFTQSPWLRWAAPLAAVAAALILAVLVPGMWRSEPSPYRGGETREILSETPETAVLPREQADLRWSAGPPGSRYEVRVLTPEGREIAVESDLTTPQYRIPPSALQGVEAGSVLYWQVKALPPDGASVVSKTFSVRLE
ncbi:MAG TPA: hypothetical protein VLQ45_07730 [Thermoanaerobaculia bacterium]|nr:hypothetical protein [Thermoanaerobaculia bacterium]